MNRYWQTDKTKWFGRSYIGTPKKGEAIGPRHKFVGPWPFGDGGDENSQAGRLSRAYRAAFEAVDELRAKRDQVEATGKYLPLGITELVGDAAMTGAIPKLRRARAIVDNVKKEIEDRAKQLKIAKPANEDERFEQQEIRAAIRAMNEKERSLFLNGDLNSGVKGNRYDPKIAAAIANGIPALSGLHPAVHAGIVNEQLEREHGEAIAELKDIGELLVQADRAVSLGRKEVREIVGVDAETFEKIAEAGERNGGELPFRVVETVQNGKVIESAEVYDQDAKRWRTATSDEITKSTAESVSQSLSGKSWDQCVTHEQKVAFLKSRSGEAA